MNRLLSYTAHNLLAEAAKACLEMGRMQTSSEAHGKMHGARGAMLLELRRLERKGFIRRTGKTWSTGRVTDDGVRYLASHPIPEKRNSHHVNRGGLGADGGTKYPASLHEVDRVTILSDGVHNHKLGRIVLKGRHKRLPMRAITLEEGKTCPAGCSLRSACYGGNMPFAKRIRWEGRETGAIIAETIASSPASLVRLHTLGDFPTLEYAGQVLLALRTAGSAAFGFTHHQPETREGAGLRELSQKFWNRFSIRTSYLHGSRPPIAERSAVIVAHPSQAKQHNAILCPEQQGKVKNCGACGLCWNTQRPIAFMLHGHPIAPAPKVSA
jgi:hypothetical protein